MANIKLGARNLVGSAFALIALLSSTVSVAEENPGWYFGVEGAYSKVLDSDGTLTSPGAPATSGTPGTPGTPAGAPCLIPAIPLPPGCGTPATPGTPGTPGTPAGPKASAPAKTSYSGGYATGFNIGYATGAGFRPELNFGYSRSDIKSFTVSGVNSAASDDNVKAYRFMANLWYDINSSSDFVPYFGAGIGAQQTKIKLSSKSADRSAFAYQVGAGFNWWFTRHATLSLDYRFSDSRPKFDLGAGSELDSKIQANQIGLGLKYFFKGKGEAVPTPAPPPVEVVAVVPPVLPPVEMPPPPHVNKCPNKPAGIPAQFLDADGCPLDSDGDGIPDYLDECPHSPPGAKVLPNGCALKGDCRTPRPGEAVDENGCALSKSFVLRGVKFEFDSDRLLPQSKEILNDVAETMKSYPEVNVEVSGHTDYIGTDAYNLGLSERRANAVKAYLEGRGIPSRRMAPVGYGKTVPIDTNETEAGRENNRRVEFKVNE